MGVEQTPTGMTRRQFLVALGGGAAGGALVNLLPPALRGFFEKPQPQVPNLPVYSDANVGQPVVPDGSGYLVAKTYAVRMTALVPPSHATLSTLDGTVLAEKQFEVPADAETNGRFRSHSITDFGIAPEYRDGWTHPLLIRVYWGGFSEPLFESTTRALPKLAEDNREYFGVGPFGVNLYRRQSAAGDLETRAIVWTSGTEYDEIPVSTHWVQFNLWEINPRRPWRGGAFVTSGQLGSKYGTSLAGGDSLGLLARAKPYRLEVWQGNNQGSREGYHLTAIFIPDRLPIRNQ